MTDFIVCSGGILNVADYALGIGIILLVISVFIDWLKGKKWDEKIAQQKEDV